MAINVQHNVLGLQVSVDNVMGMQILNRQENFKEILFSLILSEPHDFSLQVKELSAGTILQYHNKVSLCLNEALHLHQERKSNYPVDADFIGNKRLFVLQFAFFYEFSCVKDPICLIPSQIYLTKPSNSNALQNIISLNILYL